MLVTATVMAARKMATYKRVLWAIREIPHVDRMYINFEGTWEQSMPVKDFMLDSPVPWDYDVWNISDTSWRTTPQFDQDQRRLWRIVTARNMAIDYAYSAGADYLLFVDADVVITTEGVSHLLDLNARLCGGLVPGRGEHSHVNYVFGARRGFEEQGPLIICDHGTCGYMLIHRDVFSRLRFRFGPDHEGQFELSEDPAYCEDWYQMSGERFIIDRRAVAQHLDDPHKPLTLAEAVNDYHG